MSPVTLPQLKVEPLKPTGCLDHYNYFEVTPCIGRQYTDLQLKDLLNAPNSDELIREFGIIVSTRGVVFLREQDLTLQQHKAFVKRLGELTAQGKKESGLHVHPAVRAKTEAIVHEEAQADHEAFLVSNRLWKKMFAKPKKANEDPKMAKKNTTGASQWHTDLMFEHVPADYSFLRMYIHPPSGGDTLWASATEMYQRMSTPFQKYLQTLTIQTSQYDTFNNAAAASGFELWTEPRGHKLNQGNQFIAKHPVVRTNPVTGKNSLYGIGLHVEKVNDVTKAESDYLLKKFLDTITQNHDLQVRFRWEPNSCAIWDNRAVYHAATPDFDDKYERLGVRYTSCGEVPYFDPNADAYQEALEALEAGEENGQVNGHTNGVRNGVNGHSNGVKVRA